MMVDEGAVLTSNNKITASNYKFAFIYSRILARESHHREAQSSLVIGVIFYK